MVRLQRDTVQTIVLQIEDCLNSTMVRLQRENLNLTKWSARWSLNSTMVRLQLLEKLIVLLVDQMVVSIPLWFDYNLIKITVKLLKSNIVSIPLWFDYNPRRIRSYSISSSLGLNSTMVRLQQWVESLDGVEILKSSQFHYGSITTVGLKRFSFDFQ